MDLGTSLNGFRQCFNVVPEHDNRSKIGPRQFVINLIFNLNAMDRGKRTLGALRRSITKATGLPMWRGGFWERLATERLFGFLLLLVQTAMQQMSNIVLPGHQLQSLMDFLKVKGILVLDSTSITLPEMAGAIFPGPRNNVASAVIKWHNCFDLFGGSIKWFDLSPGTSHDSNHFPDLSLLVGYLIIFDLGYFDLCTLQAIANIGGYFLCRIKSNTVVYIEEVVRGLPESFVGKRLFSARLPKGKSVIEVVGSFGGGLFYFRVIGFWNPIDNCYHWYVTNLSAPPKLIYPLYRLRWYVELFFKMAKSSWRLSDITSANPNIVYNLLLASLVVAILSQPLAFSLVTLKYKDENEVPIPSVQRAGIVVANASPELRDFLLTGRASAESKLISCLKLFTDELIDPNRKRESSMQRVLRMSGLRSEKW